MPCRRPLLALLLPAALVARAESQSYAQRDPVEDEYLNVPFTQKLDAQLPLDLTFTTDEGKTVRLDELRRGKPVLLAFVYFECPSICNVLLNGMVQSLKNLDLAAGQDFDLWTVSFNPKEGVALAHGKREAYLKLYGRESARAGWRFLTGDEANIRALTDAAGFAYKWNPNTQEYAHPAGVLLLTPEGRISSYLFGTGFEKKDLQLGLVDAGQGKIGSLADKLKLMICYRYSPVLGKYTLLINRTVAAACLVTVAALVVLLFVLFRQDASKKWPKPAPPAPT
jgi:protein SCO1/2